MDDIRNRDMKDLINFLFFLLNRQNFHLHQIRNEEKRFRKAVDCYATTHTKLSHVCQIRDFQLLLAENSRQMKIHHEKLQKFLDLNGDLKDTPLYQKATEVLKETLHTM
ncbi:uncharacterized protein LOC132785666 [Drosophila nasuta]|uniref:Uncharacterized protein LOC117574763 n=1 Tax=Drosophila albomicans TaxID=7291 RepID=A0A6P8ZCX9_DROAB|nr:uncharacterized protein LOC117574763 [Drosophila albomicans]XP_060647846.1 uncharacterized protein LOC132785666 [Drosophila nasuta]